LRERAGVGVVDACSHCDDCERLPGLAPRLRKGRFASLWAAPIETLGFEGKRESVPWMSRVSPTSPHRCKFIELHRLKASPASARSMRPVTRLLLPDASLTASVPPEYQLLQRSNTLYALMLKCHFVVGVSMGFCPAPWRPSRASFRAIPSGVRRLGGGRASC
jgi:hypothetical protein